MGESQKNIKNKRGDIRLLEVKHKRSLKETIEQIGRFGEV